MSTFRTERRIKATTRPAATAHRGDCAVAWTVALGAVALLALTLAGVA
jgi:hypothetical protein